MLCTINYIIYYKKIGSICNKALQQALMVKKRSSDKHSTVNLQCFTLATSL